MSCRPPRVLVVAVLLAAVAAAQDPEQLRTAIAKNQRELQQLRAEADALLDARIRYDLGLPIGDLQVLRGEAAATTPAIAQLEQGLQQEDASTATLLARYERLRQQVQQLRSDNQKQAQQARRGDEEWITVPVAGGTAAPAPEGAAAAPFPAAGPETGPPGDGAAGAEAAASAAPPSSGVRVVPNLDPIRAQIHGSDDHGLVAQSLFKAAQALMDRAADLRARGQQDAADQVDDEAMQRLVRAVEELKPVTSVAKPELADLFHLGKSRELMFRIGERRNGLSPAKDAGEYRKREQEVRDPFVAITARDVVMRGGTEQLGPWGRAAQAALDHFRWMNLHAAYAPKVDPASITWTAQSQH